MRQKVGGGRTSAGKVGEDALLIGDGAVLGELLFGFDAVDGDFDGDDGSKQTFDVGLTPWRDQQALRLERAEHQLSQGATMESAARDAGFEDARMLRRLRNRPA